eukprot:1688420-Pyramimonas_sp.AAC.2
MSSSGQWILRFTRYGWCSMNDASAHVISTMTSLIQCIMPSLLENIPALPASDWSVRCTNVMFVSGAQGALKLDEITLTDWLSALVRTPCFVAATV